jgi:hypothetical protein
MKALLLALVVVAWAAPASAQGHSYTGFLEGRGFVFAEAAPNDPERVVGDGLFRNEAVLRFGWLHLAGGLDLRGNTHDQVEDEWRLDVEDRGRLRPRVSLRRAAATVAHRGVTLDLGKQFIRWGRADIIYPTDRFAPRDYINVIDSELLPVFAARAALQVRDETLEAIWSPQPTPSRLPLLDQRWVSLPPEVAGLTVVDGAPVLPGGSQFGVRWRHTGSRVETALSFFDGFNHHPDLEARLQPAAGAVEVVQRHPEIRMYGGDIALPTRYLTLKGEAAWVTSPEATSDEYVLYVVEVERQVGEWLLDVGYAGEVVRERRAARVFAPDRSMARSIIGRAAYTLDPRRTVAFEGAVRQSGDGFYGKVDYSQAFGAHWRLTLTGVGLGGDEDDFLGQYQRNSHASVALRLTF